MQKLARKATTAAWRQGPSCARSPCARPSGVCVCVCVCVVAAEVEQVVAVVAGGAGVGEAAGGAQALVVVGGMFQW